MKKYMKPELFYERYELTQHIADCQWEMKTNMDSNNCVAFGEKDSVYEGMSLFVSSAVCLFATEDSVWEDYCYHSGPDGALKVFAS